MSLRDKIEKIIQEALHPLSLDVRDLSHQHAGHAGFHEDGSHFSVIVVAEVFRNKSQVECHRIIYRLFAEEIKQKIHALQITAKAPPPL